MKDVQMEADYRNIPIKNVGINNLKWPITVLDKVKGKQHSVANISVSCDLPRDIRGTHMSRFVECLQNLDMVSPKNIEKILDELRERLGARTSSIEMDFIYFIEKTAPVSNIKSPTDIKCSFKAEKSSEFNLILKVLVPVHTLCPCSKEISKYSAHNQRAVVSIEVQADHLVWFEELVKVAEESASVPIYSLLKRPDEKWVTENAYDNPRFVEDVAREAAAKLENNDLIKWYRVTVESIESIHNHNAFASVEKGAEL